VLLILISISLNFRHPVLGKIFGVSAILIGMATLPTISAAVRKVAWDGSSGAPKLSLFQTAEVGISAVFETTSEEFTENTWRFLTDRISEASMFARYIDSVETTGMREGVEILKQAALTPVPRIIWKAKPNIEELVRTRVLNHGIISEHSQVSAKPHPVVDGYLVGGAVGIILTFAGLGAFASFASRLSERLLGGYLLGGVFFNGLFSILWRGGCFEFMANSLVWSLILMFAIHWAGVYFGYLIRTPVHPRRRLRPRRGQSGIQALEDSAGAPQVTNQA
jgi:hypothetical protein